MHEGIELWTSFISVRWLNTESFFCEGSALDDISPILILVKTEDLGCSSFFNLWKTEGLGILPFSILLNTEGPERRCHDIADVLKLILAFSPSLSSASSAVIYCVTDFLSLRHLEILIG